MERRICVGGVDARVAAVTGDPEQPVVRAGEGESALSWVPPMASVHVLGADREAEHCSVRSPALSVWRLVGTLLSHALQSDRKTPLNPRCRTGRRCRCSAVRPDDSAVGAEEHLIRVARHEGDRVLIRMLRLTRALRIARLVGPRRPCVGREQDSGPRSAARPEVRTAGARCSSSGPRARPCSAGSRETRWPCRRCTVRRSSRSCVAGVPSTGFDSRVQAALLDAVSVEAGWPASSTRYAWLPVEPAFASDR